MLDEVVLISAILSTVVRFNLLYNNDELNHEWRSRCIQIRREGGYSMQLRMGFLQSRDVKYCSLFSY